MNVRGILGITLVMTMGCGQAGLNGEMPQIALLGLVATPASATLPGSEGCEANFRLQNLRSLTSGILTISLTDQSGMLELSEGCSSRRLMAYSGSCTLTVTVAHPPGPAWSGSQARLTIAERGTMIGGVTNQLEIPIEVVTQTQGSAGCGPVTVGGSNSI